MTATDPTRRALAHPVRLRIVNVLRTTPMSAAELARELGLPYAVAVRHLRRLADAELVVRAEEGRHTARATGERWMCPDPWEDFRYRLAALLVTLHDAARPAVARPAADPVGAKVMAFPLVR